VGKRIKSRSGLPPNKYLTREQVKQLEKYNKQLQDSANKQVRHRANINGMILYVMLNSGLRASELCALQMRDLPHCHGKCIIDVRKGKGCVQRSIEISSELARRFKQFAKRYRKNAHPKSPLLISENGGPMSRGCIYSKLRIFGKAAGIEHLHPHMLRHSYGYMFYNHCKDLLMLADQMGHKNITTTHIYARTNNEERRRIAESFVV